MWRLVAPAAPRRAGLAVIGGAFSGDRYQSSARRQCRQSGDNYGPAALGAAEADGKAWRDTEFGTPLGANDTQTV